MQDDTDEAAGDEHHHQDLQRADRGRTRRDQRPRRGENADTEQHERRELRRHFIMPDQKQFEQGAGGTGEKTPQEDVADRAERSRVHDRTVLHVSVRLKPDATYGYAPALIVSTS